MHLECAHGILVVGRDEDNVRHYPDCLQRFQNLEASDFRHLHVQEDKVGRARLNCFDGLVTVHTLAHNLNFRVAR